MKIHSAVIPTELPRLSVVMDRDNVAWQHRPVMLDVFGRAPRWYAANLDLAPMSWETLITIRGPLTGLHLGDPL